MLMEIDKNKEGGEVTAYKVKMIRHKGALR